MQCNNQISFCNYEEKKLKTQEKEFKIQHTKISTLVATHIFFRLIASLMRIVFQRIAKFSANDANDLEEFKKFSQSNKVV